MLVNKAVLLIIDGAGIRPPCEGNAVTATTMPRYFSLLEKYGYATLQASGPAVGLDPGMVGNSEVGHTVIGAGFVPASSLRRIQSSYDDGSWEKHPAWTILAHSKRIHIVGLLSDAGVHAHVRTIEQTYAMAISQCPDSEVIVHPILDGVDSKKGTAPRLLDALRARAIRTGVVMGRKWFCDRSGDLGLARHFVDTLCGRTLLGAFSSEALHQHLQEASEASFPGHTVDGVFIAPGEPVILTSHRADRVQQAAAALARDNPVFSMVELEGCVPQQNVFFPAVRLCTGMSFTLRKHAVANTRIAESSKFPHVTRFFNGLNDPAGETTICIPALSDSELPRHPEMSLQQLQDAVGPVIREASAPHALIVNVANLDQIGHLGRLDLACRAASYVDEAVWNIHTLCRRHGWELVITADHGNADQMLDERGLPHNSHSPHPVPMVVIPSDGHALRWQRKEGSLANVAPTVAALLGIDKPEGMEDPLVKPRKPELDFIPDGCSGWMMV
jgi:2,3-bisphosphoglycerate-independent phosphoglycerate mutase